LEKIIIQTDLQTANS